MEKSLPKVTVIGMSYNDLPHLKQSAATILQQDYENLEYVVVDGGSTDGSVEFLAKVEEKMKDRPGGTMKWVSEPDKGLYHALDKGIAMCTGDIIGIMNERFANTHVLSDMVDIIQREGTDGVHGAMDYIDEKGRVVRRWRMGKGNLNTGWMAAHPTMYLKKEVFETYGDYKIDYRIAADYEFMIRILKDGKVRLSYLPQVQVHMFHGASSTSTGNIGGYMGSLKELYRALRENDMPHPAWTAFRRTLITLYQFVPGKR